MRSILDDCRELLGPAPRRFSILDWLYLDLQPPGWVEERSEFHPVYLEQGRVRREGELGWAALVQANNALFEPGPDDHPATVVVARDASWDARPSQLRAVASSLFAKKGTSGHPPAVQAMVDRITDEHAPMLGDAQALGADAPALVTNMMVHRRYLPVPFLAFGFFPVLFVYRVPPLIVPARFWPRDLVRAWTEGSLEHLRPSAQDEARRLAA